MEDEAKSPETKRAKLNEVENNGSLHSVANNAVNNGAEVEENGSVGSKKEAVHVNGSGGAPNLDKADPAHVVSDIAVAETKAESTAEPVAGPSHKVFTSDEGAVENGTLNAQDNNVVTEFSALANADWFELPDELWSCILSWLSNKDKVTTRLVCKFLKNIVDLHASYNIKLTEEMDEERRTLLSNLRMHCLEIASFQKPEVDLSLQYPNFVKELVVTTHVSPAHFMRLCEAVKDVQTLRFMATIMSMKTFTLETREDCIKTLAGLRKLRELDVTICNFGMRPQWGCETFNTLFCSEIHQLPFNTLTTISLNIALHHPEMVKFFDFIVARSDTIRHVSARVSCIRQTTAKSSEPEDPKALQMAYDMEKLDKLKLISLHVYGAPVCEYCAITAIWNYILFNHTTLQYLTMDHHDLRVPDVMSIITSNPYLRVCKLYRVSWTSVRELEEVVMVETCKYLQELLLDFMHTFVILCGGKDFFQRTTIKFFELENLPPSLRKLTLRGYQFPRHQILSALQKMTNVEEVNLHDCIFRDEPNKLTLLQQIFTILATAECGVRRFSFSAPTDLESEGSLWKETMKEARTCGVLLPDIPPAEPTFTVVYPGESEYYDFAFTKENMKLFVEKFNTIMKS